MASCEIHAYIRFETKSRIYLSWKMFLREVELDIFLSVIAAFVLKLRCVIRRDGRAPLRYCYIWEKIHRRDFTSSANNSEKKFGRNWFKWFASDEVKMIIVRSRDLKILNRPLSLSKHSRSLVQKSNQATANAIENYSRYTMFSPWKKKRKLRQRRSVERNFQVDSRVIGIPMKKKLLCLSLAHLRYKSKVWVTAKLVCYIASEKSIATWRLWLSERHMEIPIEGVCM